MDFMQLIKNKKTILLIASCLLLGCLSKSSDTYLTSGLAKDDLEDYDGAISDYNKAIELNPHYAEAYYKRGNVKKNIKDYTGALADYTKSIEIKPDNALVY